MFFIRRNRLPLFTIASIIGLYFLWMPDYLIVTVIGYFLILIGTEIGLHRYYAHHSFTCNRTSQIFLLICIFISGAGDPIGYTRQHRYHHKHSDTLLDVHPVKTNPWKAWFRSNWVDFSNINISDLTNNKFLVFMYKHYFTLYFTFISTAVYINLYFAFYFFILPTALALNMASAVNVFCHNYGYRNFNTPDNTTNNKIINFLSWGAGLHNNHHANPSSYTNKVKSFEFDLLGSFIKYFLKK
jgi:stearoyl-CoA desaturase (delta-9 desaturase)